MRRFRDYPITDRLTWMNLLVGAVTLSLASAGFWAYDLVTFRLALIRRLSTQAQIISANSVAALMFGDPNSADTTLAALKAEPHIISAVIYTPDRQPFAGYWRGQRVAESPLSKEFAHAAGIDRFERWELVLARPILLQGKRQGTVLIRCDLEEIRGRLRQYAAIGAAVLAVSLATVLVLSWFLRRAIADPIVRLADTARIVSRQKNYSVRAPRTDRHDELGILIEAFNEMLDQIGQRDAALEEARERLEWRVEQRTAELATVNKELEAFSYSVSHDLRAPLRHIDGYVGLLEKHARTVLDERNRRYLSTISESAQRMSKLIDDLLAFSRTGRSEMRLARVRLDDLVEEVLKGLEEETDGRDIAWERESLPSVYGDASMLRQVLVNLISNALKYTRTRAQTQITVGSTKGRQGETVVFVRDNGVGFDMEYADKLFGVFQRLHHEDEFEGTGIGLASVRRIVQRHGGRTWAQGSVDGGATFYFSLPTPQED
jgi:signal transduction histidine kinase